MRRFFQLSKRYAKDHPRAGTADLLLLHDNASAHKTSAVAHNLEDTGIEVFPIRSTVPVIFADSRVEGKLAGRKFSRARDLT